MLQLLDGPCKGTFMVKRAPIFLRAVKTEHLFADNKTDVLDQLEDTPAADEKVFVYQRDGEAGAVHFLGSKDITGWYATGRYKHLTDVDGEQLRDNAKWREWVTRRIAELEPGATVTPDGFIQKGRPA